MIKQIVFHVTVGFLAWLWMIPMASFGQGQDLVSLRVEPSSRTIEPGESFAFQAIGRFANGTEKIIEANRVDWSTDNRRIAAITDDGVATGIRSGRVDIIARLGDLVDRADLRVVDVTSLRIAPLGGTIDIGEPMAFEAFATFGENSQEVRVTEDADWESANATIATVDRHGVALGISAGVVMIEARLGDQQATVVLTVNAPPVAVDDRMTTSEGTPVTLSVTENDRDLDGTIVPSTVDLNPSMPGRQTTVVVGEGQFVVDGLGNVTFTPTAGFVGDSTISYTVQDDQGALSNPATITVTVIAIVMNMPPVAVDDQATTPQDIPVTFSVTANDSDADGTIVPSTVDLDPSTPARQTTVVVAGQGTFTVDDLGNVTLTPDPDFIGDTTISYTVEDDEGLVSNAARITVGVLPGANPVLGVAKAASVLGREVTLSLRIENFGDVALRNLSLVDDLDATFGAGNYTIDPPSITTAPATSNVVLNSGYTGAAGAGAELFDGVNSALEVGEFAEISVLVTVTALTDQGNGVGVYMNTAVSGGDPPSGAQARVTDVSTDGLDPDPNGDGSPEEMTPTSIILMPNQAPLAVDDQATTPQDMPVTFSVTANDSDADGTIVPSTVDLDPSMPARQTTVVVATQGTFIADDLGNVTFTPEAGFTGESTIVYTVQDDQGEISNEARITVTVSSLIVADAGMDQTVFVEQIVTLDASGSLPAGVTFAWEIVERPEGSNTALSGASEIMPTFVADHPGTYRIELTVTNERMETSEPDTVIVTAVVPAVIAHGVGLADGGEGSITLALPGPPVQAFLTWQRRDGEADNQIRFSNGAEEITLLGIMSTDPDEARVQCFYADITPYILTSPEAVTYTVTHATSIPGAGMVVIASDLEATIEEPASSASGDLLETISRITLGADNDPRRRLIEIKAGCDFFYRNTSDPLTFEIRPSLSDRTAKITLLVGDAQSNNPPRRSEIEFASPADSLPISLGKDETGFIANDGCHWDTFGRNSGAEPPVQGCDDARFPSAGDPDRRGEVTIPTGADSALVSLRSPVPEPANRRVGVSATLSLAVLELVAPRGE